MSAKLTNPKVFTHEQYIHAVRDIALDYAISVRDTPAAQVIKGIPALSDEQLENIQHAKLVYGRGHITLRGVTTFQAWNNGRSRDEHSPQSDELVEVCALGEESWEQLAGTTIHELAHVASGLGAGHSKTWKRNCVALGLRRALASGTTYRRAMFADAVRYRLAALPLPTDGFPKNQVTALGKLILGRPCMAGIGTRGGTAFHACRQLKYECEHGQIIRAATRNLGARCLKCGFPFHLAHPDAAPAHYLTSWDDVE